MSLIVLINGHSGSGKTTLAKSLAAELRLPLLAKDLFKEVLYEHQPPADREASRMLGRAAYDLLFATIDASVDANASIVAEAPLHREFVQPRIEGWIARGASVTQLLLSADPTALEARYLARQVDGSRHPAHDTGFSLGELRATLATPIDAPEVTDTIHLDTTNFTAVDLASLVAQLGTRLGALDRPS